MGSSSDSNSFRTTEYETVSFGRGTRVPNHPKLPLFVYRNVLPDDLSDPAEGFERAYRNNRWGGTWRNGIFPYHHYHSTAHEVLGLARGEARVQFGGPQGEALTVSRGDVAILPAGTGHKRLDASGDLLVIGAYPPGQNADLIRAETDPDETVLEAIDAVGVPETDPLAGPDGPLLDEWMLT